MPRFETIQARGKHRPVDDWKRFGHNSASGFTETIECCSAFQPVVHAQALAQQAILQGSEASLSQQSLETGGEDMPEAYRWAPADPQEGALNVFATWSVDDACWLFQEIYGQVFGRAAAVINFHRVQRLLVAMIRRWLLVLCSVYYDDASLQDLAAAKGRGQRYIRALFRITYGATTCRAQAGRLERNSRFPRDDSRGCRCTTDRPYALHPKSTAAGKGRWPYPTATSRGFLHPSSGEQDSGCPRFLVHRRVRPCGPRRPAAAAAAAVLRYTAMESKSHTPKGARIPA